MSAFPPFGRKVVQLINWPQQLEFGLSDSSVAGTTLAGVRG